jgi:hypothetical protein
MACSATTGDLVVLFIHRYMDFPSKFYTKTNASQYSNRKLYDMYFMINTGTVSSYEQISFFMTLTQMCEAILYLIVVQCPS